MLLDILIVEDDPLVAMMLEDYLEILGRRTVGVAETVESALSAIAGRSIDAAIVDIHLANGETSEPVAAALNDRNIPFMVCTGGFAAPVIQIFANRPLLLKPFSLKSMEEALGALQV